MKKILFCMALLAATSAHAQTVEVGSLLNYIDMQMMYLEFVSSGFPKSDKASVCSNGTRIWGAKLTDGRESLATWKGNPSTTTPYPNPVSANDIPGVSTLKVGAYAILGDGCRIELGQFSTTDGSVQVYYQPRDANVEGGISIENKRNGQRVEDIRQHDVQEAHMLELAIPAGRYQEGDIVITMRQNVMCVFGVNIEGLTSTGLNEAFASSGIRWTGRMIDNASGLDIRVYDMLGHMVGETSGSFDMTDKPHGVYLVHCEGVSGSLKIVK